MAAFDRASIAARLRELLGGSANKALAETAARLKLDELSLRLSIDEESPHLTIEVLAAVIRQYGIDPTWLMTGTYDPASHRAALEGTLNLVQVLSDFMMPKTVRISQPTIAPFRSREDA